VFFSKENLQLLPTSNVQTIAYFEITACQLEIQCGLTKPR
jgi:hypothetical protein